MDFWLIGKSCACVHGSGEVGEVGGDVEGEVLGGEGRQRRARVSQVRRKLSAIASLSNVGLSADATTIIVQALPVSSQATSTNPLSKSPAPAGTPMYVHSLPSFQLPPILTITITSHPPPNPPSFSRRVSVSPTKKPILNPPS